MTSENLIKLIGAVLVLLIGLLISRLIGKLTYKILNNLKLNSILKNNLDLSVPGEEIISIIVKYFLYIISVIYSLNQLGITTFILQLVLIFIFVLLIILFLLSLKDVVPNLIAGLFLHQKKLIKKGDNIRVKDIKGKVVEITTTETKLETKNKDIIIIPNSILIKNEIIKEK